MAKLSANGRFEIARIVATKQLDRRVSRMTYALMSDGWVLKKVNSLGWKAYERQPRCRGYGPKLVHGMMPRGTKERADFDDRVRVTNQLADRMVDNFRAEFPNGWTFRVTRYVES